MVLWIVIKPGLVFWIELIINIKIHELVTPVSCNFVLGVLSCFGHFHFFSLGVSYFFLEHCLWFAQHITLVEVTF